MQSSMKEIDDLIRQVKTGSAFESLAAAEKIGELSRIRRGMKAFQPDDTRLESVLGTIRDVSSDFRQISALLSGLIIERSEDAGALQRLRDELVNSIAHIDELTASAPKAQRTAS